MLSLIKVSSSAHFWEKPWQANLISAMSANRNREWKSLSVWDALLSIDAHNASKCTSTCNRCSQPHTASNSSICNRGSSSPPVITYLQARLPLPRTFFPRFPSHFLIVHHSSVGNHTVSLSLSGPCLFLFIYLHQSPIAHWVRVVKQTLMRNMNLPTLSVAHFISWK